MARDDEVFKCGRGWMVEPQPDGTTLPWFLKVRYNDVIVFPELIYDDALLEEMSSYRMIAHGSSELCAFINNWDVKVFEDHKYEARRTVPIAASTGVREIGYVADDGSGEEMLLGTITLPFMTKFDTFFSISVCSLGRSKLFNDATLSSICGGTNNDGAAEEVLIEDSMTEIFIPIHGSHVSPDFAQDEMLKKSYLSLCVTGQIDLSADAIIPDISTFGSYTDFSGISIG